MRLEIVLNHLLPQDKQMTLGCLLAFMLFTFLVLKWFISHSLKKLPPGPVGLPFIGYLPLLGRKPHQTLMALSKKYGNVLGLRIGSKYVVVLGDFRAVKEAFSKEAFLGRPSFSALTEATRFPALSTISGLPWKEQRRFALSQLKNLGLGKTHLEELLMEEVANVIDQLKLSNGKSHDIHSILVPSMSNNISSLIFGHRFHHNDPARTFIDEFLHYHNRFLSQSSPMNFFPLLTKAVCSFGFFHNISVYYKLNDQFNAIIKKEIEEHQQKLDSENIRDYIDGYIKEMERRKDDPASSFTGDMLAGNVRVFFGAGSETIRTTLEWLIMLLTKHCEVQRKVQQEIDNAIGRNPPTWSDYALMHYVQAVIMEVHRWASIVTLGVARCTLEDSTVQGYDIPKGTIVIPNLWAVHRDPCYWKDPERFKPERFLSEDGSKVIKDPVLIPFSYGKRSCPGEQMADMELFLYTVSIFQNFDVQLPVGHDVDFRSTELGISLQPKMPKLCYVPR